MSLPQGIHDIPVAAYHADPCAEPSISNSLTQILLEASPYHAWCASSRLNPNFVPSDGSRVAEIGSVAHKLALMAGSDVVVIPFDSYRKKDAQEARDQAEASGKIPCLADDYVRAEKIAEPLREAAEHYLQAKMVDCLREVTIIWQADGVWCRALVDAMRRDLAAAVDLKTTAATVSPFGCTRRIYTDGYHIQRAHYVDGLDTLDPANAGKRAWAFIFGENSEPHVVSPPMELSEAGCELGRQQIKVARRIWRDCLANNKWPAYGRDPFIAEPPVYMLSQWEEKRFAGGGEPEITVANTGWAALE